VAAGLAGFLFLASSAYGSSSAHGQAAPHRFVLTALADVGTVYWRVRCPNEYSLGLHLINLTATTDVTFRTGGHVLRPTVQPGESTWFPLRKSLRQRLSTVTSSEAESIYARVAVRFNEARSLPNCFAYAPPRMSVAL
jgi:hypothetical protein